MNSELRAAVFPPGKLPAERLRVMLATLPQRDARIVIGPSLGEDAAVLDVGDRYLVATTDPVTMAAEHIGWYAAHVNANDVAVMGARPRWFFPVLLLPQGAANDSLVTEIMEQIVTTCDGLGVTVCGGHTEVTIGLDHPIVVGQMLGEVEPSRLIRKAALEVGDRLLITRGVAIEGTAILAREHAQRLAERVPEEVLARARAMLADPGISVVTAALAAAEAGVVHAMHDPTEGGVLTGLHELASAAGRGLRVWADQIPVYAETRAVCSALGIDPLGLIASGALLIGAPSAAVGGIVAALARHDIPAADIGDVVPAADGITLEAGGVRRPLVPPDRDELARILES